MIKKFCEIIHLGIAVILLLLKKKSGHVTFVSLTHANVLYKIKKVER